MNARKTIVSRNFALAADFNLFAFKHPARFNRIPKNASIVFVVKSLKNLSRHNIELGKSIIRKEKRPVYQAIRMNRWSWKLQKMRT